MRRLLSVENNSLIQIQHLSFSFDQLEVLKDISLDFHGHDQVALIGANGAGKTTLMKLVLGLLRPQSGKIVMRKNIAIGYLPQVLSLGDRLFPMTVYEVVSQGLLPGKSWPRRLTTADHETIKKSLKTFDLAELSQRRFGLLSLGQKQLVLFVRMMVQKPDVVFLDEPTSSLDINKKDSLYAILDDLKKQSIPYVIITHDLPSFQEHIQRVVYLEHTILFDGTYRAFCENKTYSPFIHTHAHKDHHDH
jgi:zinc transport system ATP-binding protein